MPKPHYPMKALIASVVSLLVGSVVGCSIGYTYCERHELRDDVELMTQSMRSSERLDALSAIFAINLIQSGENQKAVRFLCRPIADYYYMYTMPGWPTDERSVKTRNMIQQLITTNRIVADEMTNRMANYQIQRTKQ